MTSDRTLIIIRYYFRYNDSAWSILLDYDDQMRRSVHFLTIDT